MRWHTILMLLIAVAMVVQPVAIVQAFGPEHRNAQCLDKNDPTHSVFCPQPGKPIGWVKIADLNCDQLGNCSIKDNYSDCADGHCTCVHYGVPVYNHPHGKLIGALYDIEEELRDYRPGDPIFVRGETRDGYIHVFLDIDIHLPGNVLIPIKNEKDLRICG
jgi:hypothetical protein